MDKQDCVCLSDPLMNELNLLEREAKHSPKAYFEPLPTDGGGSAKRRCKDPCSSEHAHRLGSGWPPLSQRQSTTKSRFPPPPSPPHDVEGDTSFLRLPKTRALSQEQLVAEVKGIYAGLVMVEKKCVEIDQQQSQTTEKLNTEQWQALIAIHRTLLYEHHDFFLASQHPSASPALRRLATKYAMPARMWRHGIHSFLELLRERLPDSLEHMQAFVLLACSMMAQFHQDVPSFGHKWTECHSALNQYWQYLEEFKQCGGRADRCGRGHDWFPPDPFEHDQSCDSRLWQRSSDNTLDEPFDIYNFVQEEDFVLDEDSQSARLPESASTKSKHKELGFTTSELALLVLRGWLEFGLTAVSNFDIYVRVFVVLLVPGLHLK